MTAGRRDLGAAQTCLIAWLASTGFLALATWVLARWNDQSPYGHRFWATSGDFDLALRNAVAGYVLLFAFFWLLVFALGAARTGPANQTAATSNAVFVAALAAALLLCFLHAAPGLFATWIDACTREYYRIRPADPCFDCGIHRCASRADYEVRLTGLLVVVALMGGSLWFRWKARIEATL